MVHNLPPHCSWSRPYTLQQAITTNLLKAFPLAVLNTVLKRKPIFDPFLQISVLVPDTLGGFAMLAAAMNTCSCHWWRYSGDSSVQGGNCQTAAALMIFGKNLPSPGPKLAILVLSPACPEPQHWGVPSSCPFFKKVFCGLSWGQGPALPCHDLAGPCNCCVGMCLWSYPSALFLGSYDSSTLF